jgi:hypothetical protein
MSIFPIALVLLVLQTRCAKLFRDVQDREETCFFEEL